MIDNLFLKQRFVSDYNLPIVIFDEPYFSYFLDLYEDYLGSRTKWNRLENVINIEFGGNPDAFLQNYGNIRNNIINDLMQSEEYIKFNNKDMSEYDIPNYNFPSSSIYKETNDNKILISIDLKKANFQAMKYVGIIKDEDYEAFIRYYTHLDYIKESKYTRQVIFGKLNPRRQIKVEKFLIHKVYEQVYEFFKNESLLLNIEFFNTDEIVFSIVNINDDRDSYVPLFINLETYIKNNINFKIDISIDFFRLLKKTFKTHNDKKLSVYVKEFLFGFKQDKIMTVPSFYFAQIYKLIKKQTIVENDLLFLMESQLSTFKYPLTYVTEED